MIEKSISLGVIDPLEFYGINNSKLVVLKEMFPKLKIVGRGNEIFASGEEKILDLFEMKVNLLIQHYNQYNVLTLANIKRIVLENTPDIQNPDDPKSVILFGNNGKIIRARTANQKKLVEKSAKNDMIFAVGPAGSGKTYTAIALAVKALRNSEVRKIILSRPAVEAGENLGFLPGDLKEKIDPYLQPLYDALLDMIPPRKLADYLEAEIIQIAPLAYMRGRTLNEAFVILDEAQNTTTKQLKMFLTRMGTSGKFMITGDITQIDLPRKQQSGLIQAFRILKDIKGIAMVEFDKSDIIRHRLVKEIVTAYEIEEDRQEKKRESKDQ
ncbi:AAA family ATPase [Labilibaculum sp. A4]|uniref:PhoH-like protein n=1 Tax=Labilibaculum euxinus TaxID=2686357 RepID=A0A425Y3V2_9BACT|nr:PhoH family protein [Labilibaculum euxinus]MDQ1772504.1 PhoH family protein [Labilibaculum euxinus]MUP39711.1 AAA family ATPase [Labilibaculum euxinus]MVB08916.1 AAA family ATPase [Labilibaculum euxinus]MWN78211.1 AAA family ATPase [Labilibaculum euxinus]